MTYEEHHAALVAYLRVKVEAQDWHGVSDAANDLRVLEAQHEQVVLCGYQDATEVGPTVDLSAEPQRIFR